MFVINSIVPWILFVAVLPTGCYGNSDTETLYANVTSQIKDYLRPVANWSDTLNVGVNALIISLNEFDGLSGLLIITVVFNLMWTDQHIYWNPDYFSGQFDLVISSKHMWMPELFFQESFSELQGLAHDNTRARVYYNGTVQWTTGSVLHTVCSVDVTYFPFDTQICTLSASASFYSVDELTLFASKSQISTDIYKENSEWKYIKGEMVQSEIHGGPSVLKLCFHFKRRAEFFTVYIIVPLVFLSQLNLLVFVMPVTSGERTSVAITTFLSFILYMQIVNQNVPPSSQPIAYIFYYLVFLMGFSSFIMFLCSVSLTIHCRETDVPGFVKHVVMWIYNCRNSRHRNVNKSPENSVGMSFVTVRSGDMPVDEVKGECKDMRITWTMVGDLFDKVCLVSLLLVYWIFSLITFIQLYINAGLD